MDFGRETDISATDKTKRLDADFDQRTVKIEEKTADEPQICCLIQLKALNNRKSLAKKTSTVDFRNNF